MTSWRGMAAVLACSVAMPAASAEFPEGIDYVVQVQSTVASQRNPYRAPEGSDRLRANTVWLNTLRGAAVIPLASDDTRLELTGSVGRAAYDRDPALDHRPLHASVRLPWRVGDLLTGSVEHVRNATQYRWLDRTWPDGDVIRTTRQRAEIGARLTPGLTFPVLAVSRDTADYGHPRNTPLFDRRQQAGEIAVRYFSPTQSNAALGWRILDGDYHRRTPAMVSQLGGRYRDHEVFAMADWRLSDKTIVGARAGWRARRFAEPVGRDTRLPSVQVRAGWDYSPKTRFDARVWRESFANDRDENVLYSTYTGGQLFVRWRASARTFVSLGAVHEIQDDTLPGGRRVGQVTRATRLGSRVEWQMNRGVQVVIDAWQDRSRGGAGQASFTDRVVRLGVVIGYGNRTGTPERLLWVPECQPPRYVEADACQP